MLKEEPMTALMPDQRTLTGATIRLDAFVPGDAAGLFAALDDARVWAAGYGGGPVARPVDVDAFSRVMRGRLASGQRPYSVRLVSDSSLGAAGTVVGTSTLHDVDLANERLHLGWTAYSPQVWGSAVNPECKLLLLRHAFDDCGFERVKIQTDAINTRSQLAIERLGAVREGVLRHHMLRADGTRRDTVVYSMLREEWPAARDLLTRRLAIPAPAEQ
jgi:N-acetyltransferase